MTPSENIREQILDALLKQEANVALAAEYTRACRELNRRLEQIEEVIDRGDEIQALQMAEIYPPVMEEADALSFFKSREWGRLCEKNQSPVAPEIRIHGIAKLNTLYGKGISSTHPIYKELREAILTRDEERALKISRTIVSLAPGDPRAKAECERLEKKVFSNRITALEKALSENDSDVAIRILDEIEQMQPTGEPPESAEIHSARKIRNDRDSRKAGERIRQIIPELDANSGTQLWSITAEQVAIVQDLCTRYGITLDPIHQGILGNAREFSDTMRSQAVKQADFNVALRSFLICLDDASSRMQARGTLTIEEVRDLLVRLNKEWQVLESFGLPVDPARVEETSRMVEILRNELTRLQKNRVTTIASIAAAVLLLVAVSGWFIMVQYRAGEMSRGLSSARQARSMVPVKRLVADADKSYLSKFSSRLSSEIAISKKWLEALEKESASCMEGLADLLKRSADFTGEDPVKLDGEYQGLLARIKELPDDQQKVMQPDLLKLDKSYRDHLASLGAKDDKLLEEKLSSFEEISKPLAPGGLSLAEVEKILALQKESEVSWAPLVHSPIKDLPISADLRAKAEAYEEKTQKLAASVENAKTALQVMGEAKDTDAYRKALGSLKNVDLPCCNLVPEAKIAWNTDCTVEALLPELLFPGNAGAYASLKQGNSSEDQAHRLFPKSIAGTEVTAFAAILNDELTPDVKVYSLEGGDPSRKIYAKPDLNTAVDDGELSVFTGKTYDPYKDSATTPSFTIKTYRANGKGWEKVKKFVGPADAPASKIYRDLGLKDVVSESLEINISVIQLLERLTQVQEKDPVYQAFVIQQLLEMTSKRPFAWGLQYSPGAASLMKDVDQAIRVSFGNLPQGSWMAPNYQKIVPQLKPLLEKPGRFNGEAQLNKLLAEQVIDGGGLLYAGFVGEEGKPRLIADILAPPEDLYGIGGDLESRKGTRVFRAIKGSQPAGYEAMTKPVPLTPLYYLKRGRENMVEAGLHTLRIERFREELNFPPLFNDSSTSTTKTQ